MLNLVEHYRFTETFDTNLTADYEVENWDHWHIVREFISNALDGVGGDPRRVSITEDDSYICIADYGQGYPLVYAKRIGASSKRNDEGTIGQFGEGTKLALLTCFRLGIDVSICSQDWLIIPRVVPDQEGIEVLVFDIYQTDTPIAGSMVCIQATPAIVETIQRKEQYFLQFSGQTPLFGTANNGIFPREQTSTLYNQGVFVKELDALYSYGLSLSELNRDRELVDDQVLCSAMRSLWERVDNAELIREYFLASHRTFGGQNPYQEFTFLIYPDDKELWLHGFMDIFGAKAVLFTNPLAAREAVLLGYEPYQLEYHGRSVAEYAGVARDIDVIRTDYEFTWAQSLTLREQQRLDFFRQIAQMMDLHLPQDIRIFKTYAKSDHLAGHFNKDDDEIYLKRDVLQGELPEALEVFLHELCHRETGADDYSREFANGLASQLSKAVLNLAANSGVPVTLELTERGFRLPEELRFGAGDLHCRITVVGSLILIQAGGCKLRADLAGINLKPYTADRQVTFHKGRFFLNVPASIRRQLPEEVEFRMLLDPESI